MALLVASLLVSLARVPKLGLATILPQALKADGASRFIWVVCTRGQERKGDMAPVSQRGFHGSRL